MNDEEKNEFFNSFIYRAVLFDDCVYIFCNTSPSAPTKVKLDKDELSELKEYRAEAGSGAMADNRGRRRTLAVLSRIALCGVGTRNP